MSQWLAELAAAYLLLSYPSGRLRIGRQRTLFIFTALLAGLLWLPTALVGQFPHPSPWSTCSSICPRNVFSLRDSTPAVVSHLVLPVREVLLVALFAAIAVAVMQRARKARPLLGQFYAPLAVAAIAQAVVFAVYFPLRAAAPASTVVSVVGWLFVLSIPAIGLVVRRRPTGSTCPDRDRARAHGAPTQRQRQRGRRAARARRRAQGPIAANPAFVSRRLSRLGRRVGLAGRAGATPTRAQRVTHVSSGSWRIAIVHDPSLADSRELVHTTGSYALVRLEMSRLTDELRDSLHDLAESRASRLTAEQDARQKIERDLHDGAQQRLVALRVKLGLAASALAGRDAASAEMLRALVSDVDATIDEVRALARGIYPPLLARTGLRDALRSVSRGAGLPTTVRAEGLGRYGADIETTVYFACSEALQNAVKHAHGATGVTITVWQDEAIHFEVRDDGAGFDLSHHAIRHRPEQPQRSSRRGGRDDRDPIGSRPGTMLVGTIPLA